MPGPQSASSRWLRVAKSSLFVAILGVLLAYVASQWHHLRTLDPPRGDFLAWATLARFAMLALAAWNLQLLLKAQGFRVSFLQASALRYLPLLGTFIPGKVWSILGAFMLYAQQRIPKAAAAANIVIVNVVGLTSGLLLALAIGTSLISTTPLLIAVVIGLAAISLYPPIFAGLTGKLQLLLGRDEATIQLPFFTLLRYFLVNVVVHLGYGFSFHLFAQSFADVPLAALPTTVALFIAAQIAGFIAVFAPGGLGVREGVLIAGLTPLVGTAPAIAISLGCRVWQTVLEIAAGALGIWATRPASDG